MVSPVSPVSPVAVVWHGCHRVVGLHIGCFYVVIVGVVGVVVARLAGGAGQAAGTGVARNALHLSDF